MSFRNEVYENVRHVAVENMAGGSVTVETGPRPDLVEVSLNAEDERYLGEVSVRHDGEQLRVTFPPQLFRDTSAHLRLAVPDGLTFAISTGSADVSVSAPMARSKIASGSGDVTLGAATDLECTTGSGGLAVARVAGRAARLASGSGDITVGEARCPLTAKSGSGDVVVRALHDADLQASSGSGDIAVAATTGSVLLRSASGSLTVGIADGLPAWLDLNSVSGEIRIAVESAAQPRPGQRYLSVRARTASGDIAVYRA